LSKVERGFRIGRNACLSGCDGTDVVAIEADALPAERGNAGEQLMGQRFALGAKLGNGVAEVDGVPEERLRRS
jgi:hypothetical protein